MTEERVKKWLSPIAVQFVCFGLVFLVDMGKWVGNGERSSSDESSEILLLESLASPTQATVNMITATST